MEHDENNRVYFDPESKRFYRVEWIETGNNDIPEIIWITQKPNF